MLHASVDMQTSTRAAHPHTVHRHTKVFFQVLLGRPSSAAVRVVPQNQRAIPVPAQPSIMSWCQAENKAAGWQGSCG